MGRRGPPPTPTPLLKLRGSTLVTRKREAREVKAPPGVPERPDWLDEEAKALWDALVPQLQGMGVLSRVDQNALTRYCHLWSRWRKAEAFILKHGEVYPLKDEAGKVKYLQTLPQVSIALKLAQQLTRLEQELGLTPAARSRIQIASQPPAEQARGKSRFFDTA